VWADYYRLNKEEEWEQKRIAEAKGVDDSVVSARIKMHLNLPEIARKATLDGILDEGHCSAILTVVLDVKSFESWLTSSQAQTELVEEVLGKHRGSSAGIKPTVKAVREAAARWKEFIMWLCGSIHKDARLPPNNLSGSL
jgi:hypothetical protein